MDRSTHIKTSLIWLREQESCLPPLLDVQTNKESYVPSGKYFVLVEDKMDAFYARFQAPNFPHSVELMLSRVTLEVTG